MLGVAIGDNASRKQAFNIPDHEPTGITRSRFWSHYKILLLVYPHPSQPTNRRYCWVCTRNGKGVHTLPEGVRREFETSIHVKWTTIRAHCFGITHVFIPPSPARGCDDSSLIVPAFNLLCTITSNFSLPAHPVSWSIRQYIVPIISQKRASATAAVDFRVNSKNVRRMVRLWLLFNFQWVNEKWMMAKEREK